jgi:hypothetical protein
MFKVQGKTLNLEHRTLKASMSQFKFFGLQEFFRI